MAWIAATGVESDTFYARYWKKDHRQTATIDPIRLTVWSFLIVLLVLVWGGIGWTAIALI